MLYSVSNIFAQTGSVRGFVYDKETGEASMFTNIYLKGTKYGVATDLNGFFNLTKVKPGDYTLVVSCLGYDSLVAQVKIIENKIIDKKFFLTKGSIMLNESVVSAEREEMKTDTRVSIVKVSAKDIALLPSIGSEPDLAQYLQVVPGVIFTGDQGGQLYIRGGSPIQNKVLLDGMVIYNPFHSIGLFSVFDSDIIRNADVYTGGFNAEYGGRISSVMDVSTRDGNKKHLSGKFSASTFGSKLLLEGPIKKAKDSNSGSSSFIVSGKTSFLEQTSKELYNYIDEDGLPFNYTDLYGKVSLNSANGSKLNLFGFNFTDQVKYKALSNLNWDSYGVGANVIVVPGSSPVLVKANFSYSDYKVALTELKLTANEKPKPRESEIKGYNFDLDFIYFLGKNELDYGIQTLGFSTDYTFYNSVGRLLQQSQNTTELGAYLKFKYTVGRLILEPGFRLHYYSSLSETSPEPRLGIKYNLTDKFRIKFAGGYYSQNLIAGSSDRDVVNLFYGFLSGPELGALPGEFEGEKVTSALQKSRHAILGFEYDLTTRINLNVEGYVKDNTQLTNINKNKLFDESSSAPDELKKDFVIETGNAYGIDFVLKYDYKRFYFWAVYSLGYVNRYDGFTHYVPHYDRRHNVNLVSSYTFGKDFGWEISVRWNYGSGFPFTQTQGFYEELPLNNVSSNYTSVNGNMGVMYGEYNKGRLPSYHRLDLNISKKFQFSINSTLETVISITNVYDRQNIFYYDRMANERVDQLPFMPSFGLSLTF